MSGECDNCGEHAVDCQCVHKIRNDVDCECFMCGSACYGWQNLSPQEVKYIEFWQKRCIEWSDHTVSLNAVDPGPEILESIGIDVTPEEYDRLFKQP